MMRLEKYLDVNPETEKLRNEFFETPKTNETSENLRLST